METKRSDVHRPELVTIYWHAVPNADERRGGWMPVFDLNGKLYGSTYGQGYDLEIALKMAKENAEAEASHYVGDWNLIVASKEAAA